ncbi:hypothetical protein F511_47303 [Dorcoceras hygrometricum]|uniref:Uncharacterized protein n=1 Tax=Dorcoceras hygrometricum TaxID=472368 RepID=A0A2Z6ZRD2_9LAMI|nr:hypothetical protein F511_47303 [Dorcoceras hygrometricum]
MFFDWYIATGKLRDWYTSRLVHQSTGTLQRKLSPRLEATVPPEQDTFNGS